MPRKPSRKSGKSKRERKPSPRRAAAAKRDEAPSSGLRARSLTAVFDSNPEGLMILGPDFVVEAVNPACTAVTGHSARELIGGRPEFLTAKTAPKDLAETIVAAVRGYGRWEYEYQGKRKTGEVYTARLAFSGIAETDGSISGYVVSLSDISKRRQEEERVRYQANYDALTGLPNRSLFMDRLTQAVNSAERSGQRVAVMFIDLDGFKQVNDTLGHDIGDELLRESARRLTANVRTGDTVARVGGDEFTVVMPNLTGLQFAPVVAQRIITSLEQPFKFGRNEAFVSASIGITAYPDDARDVHALLRNADAAMYRAKEQGKANYQFYTADLNAQAAERQAIKIGLAKALKRNEFMIDYQPRSDLQSGRLAGVEAFLRWHSRELGMLSPGKFVPVADETGAITAIGEWMLATACAEQKRWAELGFPDLRVSINVSGRQLRQPGLVRTVAEVLERVGASPRGLEIEVTEGMIVRDPEHAGDVLRALSATGIRITVDDFGTGYSSLSVLKRFPIDTIKIDESYIRDIARDAASADIVRAIVSMGHALRRRVVAEGVETKEQASLLREIACDEIQGYLISPPVPAAQVDRMLESTGRPIHA